MDGLQVGRRLHQLQNKIQAMSLIKNFLLFTGIGGGIGIFTLGRYRRLGKELQVVPSHRISNFTLLKGFTLELDATIKNPTNVKLDIRFPFMSLMMGSELLGSSTVVDKIVTIPAHGQVSLDPIQIPVKGSEEADALVQLFLALESGQPVNADLVVDSAVESAFLEISFQKTVPISLTTA